MLSAVISARDTLAGSFTVLDDVDLVKLEKSISPRRSTATLRRFTGKWKGTEAPIEELERLVAYEDLRGKQIKIEVTDADDNVDTFYGYCPAATESILGTTDTVRASDDTYTVYGVEYYLERTTLEKSLVKNGATVSGIERALPFNIVNEAGALMGNKLSGENYISDDLSTAEKWTGLSIVEYLLNLFNSEAGIEYTLAGQHADLANIEASYQTEGRTFWQILNEVISPERGFSFYVGTENNPYEIYVFTTTSTQIGTYIPANPNTRTATLDTSHEIHAPSVQLQEDNHFDRILVRGGRIRGTATFTFSEHFEKGWTTQDETDYAAATDAERTSDKFEHVYNRFYLKSDWNGDAAGANAIPAIDPTDGSLDTATKQSLYIPLFQFNRNLAILEDGQPRLPFAIMEAAESKKHRLDNPGGDLAGASLTVLTGNKPGILLRSRYPHLLGLNAFTGDSEKEAVFDYTTLKATLSYTLDEHLRVESSSNEVGAFEKSKIIDIPESSLWFITPNTVTNLDDQSEETSSGTHTESFNDVSTLQKYAEMALAWYGRQKAVVSWDYKILKVLDRLGYILTTYQVNGVNYPAEAVISKVIYDFGGDYPETKIQTEQRGISFKSILSSRKTATLKSVQEQIHSIKKELSNIPSRTPRTTGGAAGGIDYYQVTDVDYAANNGLIGSPTFIYRGIKVDDPETPLLVSPEEDDKVNIKIIDGYPWSLIVGDNIPVVASTDTYVKALNILCPDPIIKIETTGTVKVYDKETAGTALKTLTASEYKIMSSPTSIVLSTYDDTFMISQWCKREEKVRIYIPVI